MSEFDNLRQALAASLHQRDCNKARVLAAKLLVRAKTPGEREAVQQAQQRVATCSVNLGGARKAKSCKYTVEPGRNIYRNGEPYISIRREGTTIPAHADRLTHHVAAYLNRKGCLKTEFYPERSDRWTKELSGSRKRLPIRKRK